MGGVITPSVKEVKTRHVTPKKTEIQRYFKGEHLKWRVHYGPIDAGLCEVKIQESTTKVGDKNLLHVVGLGRSRGTFDWFFKVRDRYETYIDDEDGYPWMFVRRVSEGGYIINQDYTFYQHLGKVDNGKGKQFDVPLGVQDMLSAFYHTRTFDYSDAQIGDVYSFDSFVDDELWGLSIKYYGTDTVKVGKKKYSCLKFVPVIQEGRIFENEEDMMVWITNDKNMIPVLAEARILFGALKMEITSYEGLHYPVAIVD